VSLLWGFKNPAHEQRLRELAREEFAPSYLGNVPVFLSSEVMPTSGEYERTQSVVLDAYLSQLMQEHIADIKDRLEEFGYEDEIQMIHTTGGMAESYKTTAVNTYTGGPVAGLIGSETLSNRFGYDQAVVTDMGGTSFDIGLVVSGGTQSYEFEPTIGRFAVAGTMVESKSIGAGGGSVAWINEELGDRVEVGPQSAGADPGPACYNRGGTRPTVTDADVVLGYIDPEGFYAGRQTLDVGLAEEAIERYIADPLGIGVVEGATLIRDITDGNMGDTIRKETLLRGFDPREFLLYSFGGAGPVHCASYAAHIGIDEILVSPYSPVFCAFGSSTMNTLHIYEQSESLYLLQPGGQAFTDDYETFNGVVDELMADGRRDLTGEGFDEEEIEYELELQMRFGGQIHVARSPSPVLKLESGTDAKTIYDRFVEEYKKRFSNYSVTPDQGLMIENFVLKAQGPRSSIDLPEHDLVDADPGAARNGERDIYWEQRGGFETTPTYDYYSTHAGMEIEGPAVVDADFTSTVVPPRWSYTLDEHMDGMLRRRE
jgi:N-methylhydantoinase A/acetophenone carboxylase